MEPTFQTDGGDFVKSVRSRLVVRTRDENSLVLLRRILMAASSRRNELWVRLIIIYRGYICYKIEAGGWGCLRVVEVYIADEAGRSFPYDRTPVSGTQRKGPGRGHTPGAFGRAIGGFRCPHPSGSLTRSTPLGTLR